MVIHYTNIYNNVVFPDKKACIFRFKGRKSCANGDSVTLEFMIGPTSGGTAEVLNMFKVAAVPPRRFAMLTVFRGTKAINDGTSAEPRRSWRYHCGLCLTNTAVARRPRCDGNIMSAVLTICRGFTAINDETTAEPRRSWRWHCGLCRTSTAVAPRLRCDGGITPIIISTRSAGNPWVA